MSNRSKYRPPAHMRPFVRALGNDKDAMRKLCAELDRQGKAAGASDAEVARLKAGISDWCIEGLRAADKAGIRDWDSPEAAAAFGFDDTDAGES